MKFGIDLPNMRDCAEPRLLAEIAREAEESGWDGVFIFDTLYSGDWGVTPGEEAIAPPTADPWIALAAMAMRTERVRLGTMITPLARRRPWKLARETVTLDHLSNGRMVLPVGLGWVPDGGFSKVHEELDRRKRAEKLNEALAIVGGLWTGDPFSFKGEHYQVDEMTFLPKPVQSPRIPVWVVGAWPYEKSMRRALRWDGVLPVAMRDGGPAEPSPEDAARAIAAEGAYSGITVEEITAITSYVRQHRGARAGFDIVIEGNSSGSQPEKAASVMSAYGEAGVTWWIEGVWSWLALPPRDVDRMRRRIRQGPPRIS